MYILGRRRAFSDCLQKIRSSRLSAQTSHQFEVRLIGDVPQRGKLEEMIAENDLGSCVAITGFLSDIHLTEALNDEASGGDSRSVGDAGLTFLPGDAQALARRMRGVLQDPSISDTIRRHASAK